MKKLSLIVCSFLLCSAAFANVNKSGGGVIHFTPLHVAIGDYDHGQGGDPNAPNCAQIPNVCNCPGGVCRILMDWDGSASVSGDLTGAVYPDPITGTLRLELDAMTASSSSGAAAADGNFPAYGVSLPMSVIMELGYSNITIIDGNYPISYATNPNGTIILNALLVR